MARVGRKLFHEPWMTEHRMRDALTGAQYLPDEVEWLGLDEDGDGHVKARDTGIVFDCAEHAWQGWLDGYERRHAQLEVEADKAREDAWSEEPDLGDAGDHARGEGGR